MDVGVVAAVSSAGGRHTSSWWGKCGEWEGEGGMQWEMEIKGVKIREDRSETKKIIKWEWNTCGILMGMHWKWNTFEFSLSWILEIGNGCGAIRDSRTWFCQEFPQLNCVLYWKNRKYIIYIEFTFSFLYAQNSIKLLYRVFAKRLCCPYFSPGLVDCYETRSMSIDSI